MIYFNEEWNEPNEEKLQVEHNIDSITNYHPRNKNSIYYKTKDTLRDLYFFE